MTCFWGAYCHYGNSKSQPDLFCSDPKPLLVLSRTLVPVPCPTLLFNHNICLISAHYSITDEHYQWVMYHRRSAIVVWVSFQALSLFQFTIASIFESIVLCFLCSLFNYPSASRCFYTPTLMLKHFLSLSHTPPFLNFLSSLNEAHLYNPLSFSKCSSLLKTLTYTAELIFL